MIKGNTSTRVEWEPGSRERGLLGFGVAFVWIETCIAMKIKLKMRSLQTQLLTIIHSRLSSIYTYSQGWGTNNILGVLLIIHKSFKLVFLICVLSEISLKRKKMFKISVREKQNKKSFKEFLLSTKKSIVLRVLPLKAC